jgi:HTH-type transcriptional regulator / antitoxin HipB
MRFPLQTIDQLKPLIQGFRKQAGLTQAAMAEKLGITQQSYAQIESNLGSTSVERLYTILRLLDVELNFSPPDTPAGKRHGDAPAVAQKPAAYIAKKPATKTPTARSATPPPQPVPQSDKTKW